MMKTKNIFRIVKYKKWYKNFKNFLCGEITKTSMNLLQSFLWKAAKYNSWASERVKIWGMGNPESVFRNKEGGPTKYRNTKHSRGMGGERKVGTRANSRDESNGNGIPYYRSRTNYRRNESREIWGARKVGTRANSRNEWSGIGIPDYRIRTNYTPEYEKNLVKFEVRAGSQRVPNYISRTNYRPEYETNPVECEVRARSELVKIRWTSEAESGFGITKNEPTIHRNTKRSPWILRCAHGRNACELEEQVKRNRHSWLQK